MKILLTSPYRLFPVNSGGSVRTISLAKALQSFGHAVHVLSARPAASFIRQEELVHHFYNSSSVVGHFLNADFRQVLQHILNQSFDLVICGFPFQSWMIVPILRKNRVPLIYDAHNVEADRFKQVRQPMIAILVKMAERYMCRSADSVLTVSEDDQRLMKSVHRIDSIVLANGVDTEAMAPGPANEAALRHYGLREGEYVLFFGSYDYPPNVEAARFLIEAVWPKVLSNAMDIKLAFVGRSPRPWMEGRGNIVVTGAVEDISNIIRGARVVLAPLFSGGGSRLKILEALACGKEVLATPFGAKGIATNDSSALHLATPENFAERLKTLLSKPRGDFCGNREARALAERFNWRRLVANALPLFESVAKR